MSILETLGINPAFILIQLVGFLIMVFILVKFAFGPIFGLLQQRQDTIRHDLDEAESRRLEMERLQREYEARLAQIEDEARDKIQAAVRDAQAARDEIIARAHAESQAIARRGTEDIQRERDKAMAEMRNQIAELAIMAAGRVVRQSLDGQSHARLIDEVIAGFGGDGAGPTSGGAGGSSTGGGSAGGRR